MVDYYVRTFPPGDQGNWAFNGSTYTTPTDLPFISRTQLVAFQQPNGAYMGWDVTRNSFLAPDGQPYSDSEATNMEWLYIVNMFYGLFCAGNDIELPPPRLVTGGDTISWNYYQTLA